MKYTIYETNDFYPLSVLFNESGLEVDISENTPSATLKMWRADDENGNLLAACTIEFKDGCFVLENLAVRKDIRKSGLGKIFLDISEEEFKKRGAKRIWGCAKVPEYYFQFGWEEHDRDSAPEVSHCVTCPQFNKSCFPSIIYKDI